MANRKSLFAIGEHYHIYNRGVDKRITFTDEYDIRRFFQSMVEFNTVDPIGSLYENSFLQLGGETPKLVRSMSSWGEYTDKRIKGICEKDIILGQLGYPHDASSSDIM